MATKKKSNGWIEIVVAAVVVIIALNFGLVGLAVAVLVIFALTYSYYRGQKSAKASPASSSPAS